MIAIERLTYHYPHGTQPALRDVSWAVPEGAFVLLAGPSGSGKSTLLRCLNGLVPHFSGGTLAGRVFVEGIDAVAAGPRVLSRRVGFVAQDPEAQAVVDRVEGEIAFALENAAAPPAEMRLRVEEVLDLLDLSPLRERRLATLSGGERQRLAIAAALALRPRVLVLDEPTSQLDPQSAEDVLRALVRLNHDLGLTVVLAEHRLERVTRHADRLTYLADGRIALDGPPRQVLDAMPVAPPLIQVAQRLGWRPLPLTVKEGRAFAAAFGATSAPLPAPVVPQPAPRPTATPALAVSGLTYAYNGNGRPALHDVNLTVMPGEAVALLGRNGAGKSTLLRSLVGLLRATGGEVAILGRNTRGRDVAEICRDVGYLPQNPDDLLFAETVMGEVRQTLDNHGLAHQEAGPLLDRLGLAELAAAYPRDLSVGQRQRVALGAVTATRPRLLLLDEPTRGLDRPTKEGLAVLWQSWKAEGVAILIATHDVELAALLTERAVLLSRGEVVAAGTTHDVLTSAPHFAPQMARLFPGRGWLTVEDVFQAIGN